MTILEQLFRCLHACMAESWVLLGADEQVVWIVGMHFIARQHEHLHVSVIAQFRLVHAITSTSSISLIVQHIS